MTDRDAYNAYMRKYKRARYHDRKATLFRMLGGKCVVCGSTERLEIDHIDPAQKAWTVSELQNHRWSEILVEVEKCQLLCKTHHVEKTMRDQGRRLARGTHGTVSAYRYCGPPKCDECKAAKRNVDSYQNRPSRRLSLEEKQLLGRQ